MEGVIPKPGVPQPGEGSRAGTHAIGGALARSFSRLKSAKSCGSAPDVRINALGSGTDFTGFLDRLGIATLDLGYGGEDQEGI